MISFETRQARRRSERRAAEARSEVHTCDSLQENEETASHRLSLNAVLQFDPTRTTTLRNKFARDMARRFRIVKKLIWESVVENDALALIEEPRHVTNPALLEALPRRAFDFKTNPDKIDGFMAWLREQNNNFITSKGDEGLSLIFGPTRSTAGGAPWMNVYIDSAYKRGMKRADKELIKAGIKPSRLPQDAKVFDVDALFNIPTHSNAVGMLYVRSFSELQGITSAMEQTISRNLADGIAEGRSPRQVARRLINAIEKVGDLSMTDVLGRHIRAVTRARTLARTEIIRAHHTATIQMYKDAEVEGIKIKAEWSTAGDNRVCQQCAAMEGIILSIKDVEGLIPLHPNCRCVALPAAVGENKRRQRSFANRKRKRLGVGPRDATKVRRKIPTDDILDDYVPTSKLSDAELLLVRRNFAADKSSIPTGLSKAENQIVREWVGDPFAVSLDKAKYDQLTAIINKHQVSQPKVVYRGVHGEHATDLKKMKTGDVVTLDRNSSTSAASQFAEPITDIVEIVGGVEKAVDSLVMVVEMPTGARGMFIDAIQAEMLLPKGTRLTALGKRGNARAFRVEVDANVTSSKEAVK